MLPADVYSRFLRQTGDEVLFICATDEHGTPAELAALEAGMTTAAFCERQYRVMAELCERWGLSFDHFGRSSSPQNAELTQHFASVLDDNGFIDVRTTVQAYSVDEQRFLPDRYVTGTCPHCGYDRARGDQCENCTRVLDPADLIEPKSATSPASTVELRESKHLFLKQSQLADRIRAWIMSKDDWPPLSRSIALKWLDEGLQDRGITRDLEWGIPVPGRWDGFENKVFYVWFDAPIEYIGASKEWADLEPGSRDWKSWWWEADDVRYTEFMAKDNVPFHAITFPATLLASGEPWKLVDQLKSFNWLTYYGGKFSTSQQRGVFMHDALEVLPADVWRYFLIANAPEGDDADFTWQLVANAVNKDLADVLGNFVNRTLKFHQAHFSNRDFLPTAGSVENDLIEDLQQDIDALRQMYKEMQFRKVAQHLRRIWSRGNEYLETTAPWKTVKTDADAAANSIAVGVGLIRLFGYASAPVMPSIAATLLESVGASPTLVWPGDVRAIILEPVSQEAVKVPAPMFTKLLPEDISSYEERFGV